MVAPGPAGHQGPLPLLDPEGALWEKLRKKALGCVVYSPNEIVAPGVVVHLGANRWVIGEPSDKKTARLQAVIDLFNKSGLTAEDPPDLRAEVWRKLTNNPLRAIHRGRSQRLGHYEIASDWTSSAWVWAS